MNESTALVNIPPTQTENPTGQFLGGIDISSNNKLIETSHNTAEKLAEIIKHRELYVNIKGKNYVRVEGWTMLGVLMGVLAREVATTESDGIYTSVVELCRISDGMTVTRASAECGEEAPWNTRPRYARRSMSQTRATSKACRLAFSWVMALAGYESTPAEEMIQREAEEKSLAIVSQKEIKEIDNELAKYEIDKKRLVDWVLSWSKGRIKKLEDLNHGEYQIVTEKIKQVGMKKQKEMATRINDGVVYG